VRRPRRLATLTVLALTAACATSAWALYQEVHSPPGVPAPAAAALGEAVGLPDLPTPPELGLPPLAEFAAIVERPLFFPDRRPLPAEPPPPPPPKEPLTANVVGIVMSGTQGTLLLRLPKEKDAVTLRTGDIVQGWTLVEISPEGAVFERDGERAVLAPTLEDPNPRRRRRKTGTGN